MKLKNFFHASHGQIGATHLYLLPTAVPVPIQNCFLWPCTVSAPPPSTFLDPPLNALKEWPPHTLFVQVKGTLEQKLQQWRHFSTKIWHIVFSIICYTFGTFTVTLFVLLQRLVSSPWLAKRCELYIQSIVTCSSCVRLARYHRKGRTQREAECVGLALINAIIFHNARQLSMHYGNRGCHFTNRCCQPKGVWLVPVCPGINKVKGLTEMIYSTGHQWALPPQSGSLLHLSIQYLLCTYIQWQLWLIH